ncbi:MAG TPA: endonuclease/exonuclease/phosphatase family protein [Kofleriaceae bacterium]|nr:endonuclease/exonuclease/phosphatase family protein [Kofleriaceae bacterium]
MSGRLVLFATLGALVASFAGCGSPDPGDTPPDGAVADAAPDGSDDTAPDTTITDGPTGNVTVGQALVYTFTTDTGTSFECRVDAVAFAGCTSPHTITALAGLHAFEVRAIDARGVADPTPAARGYYGYGVGGGTRVRIVAGNLTSGNYQAYEAPGTRIFQGLKPDIALIQEFNVGDNAPATVRAWVDTTFGASFFVYREPGAQIPNGIVSRYPILQSGIWEDPVSPNREFAYARIDVPGPKDLWAVSLHLLTTDSSRPAEATALVNYINTNVPAGDYLVVGGDLNSDTRTEPAITTIGQVVDIAGPFPVDQGGDGDTNAGRNKPYDWVMFDADLKPLEVPVTIGAASFPNGLVFDSRVYTPLADVSPIQLGDSAAPMMQHMAVVRDIQLTP